MTGKYVRPSILNPKNYFKITLTEESVVLQTKNATAANCVSWMTITNIINSEHIAPPGSKFIVNQSVT